MTVKLAVASLADTSAVLILGCLVTDVLACALLLQGAFFGTKVTYGGYSR
jgi:hypothetical protein